LRPVSLYEWLLFLHVLSAFALVAGEVLFTFLIVDGRRRDDPAAVVRVFRFSPLGNVLIGVGSGGVLVLGVVIAFQADAYAIWDGWIVAALVLWFVLAELGRRTGNVYNRARDRARALVHQGQVAPSPELNAVLRSPSGLALHAASVAIVLLLLLDMIFKPGA
jgi:uncharacterized membrane protein